MGDADRFLSPGHNHQWYSGGAAGSLPPVYNQHWYGGSPALRFTDLGAFVAAESDVTTYTVP